ncbi:hydrogenase expression/formation protein [Methylocystis sp. ATCC 49242]|uniref:hydrogenase expression/formation protein n=1 Tax=Methylocystis sp. ATCC 49242 TaxID=622637 RepID=UPI0001F886B9|nr:hydrogenase expression/formation protein [Methylocystis sp. ATCC 49242]
MKAGFWMAPAGAEAAMTIAPIGVDELATPGRTGSGAVHGLARAGVEGLIQRCERVGRLLPELADALARQKADAPGRLVDVTEYDADERELLSQALGSGEVSGVVALPDGVTAQISESTMAGLWRVRFSDADERVIGDYLEIAAIPEVVRRAAVANARDVAFGAPPENVMNVMPLLAEIRARVDAFEPGAESHIVNFSLFPMTPEDMAFLQHTLGDGPVGLLSRGYGKCRIHATATRHVWSVQYFNAMDEIVLDTLEIGDVPVVGQAAVEDFRDSSERLLEIHEAYFK